MPEPIPYRRPPLYAKQQAAIFCPERYGLIEASTKVGKTAGCMVWLLEQAMQGHAHQNFWWVAPVQKQATMVFDRLRHSIPQNVYDKNLTGKTITLKNLARLSFLTAEDPDNLYGDDVYAAVVDEASRVKEDAWYAVRTTLTKTNGPIRIIGNVKGRKNWFYQMARRAEAGAANMHYAKLIAHDAVQAGILSEAEVADARAQMPEHIFRELYLAEPSDDGGNPFGISAIASCVGDLSTNQTVVFGCDLAKSVDWTVLIGLDASGHVTRVERWQLPWEETTARLLTICGSTPTLTDSTGVGDPVLEGLQKRGRDDGAQFLGFKFTSQSKQQIMEGLAVAIQRLEITFPDGPIRHELETFEYEYSRTGVRYTAPDGLHDDCVCALALAVAQWRSLRPALTFWAAGEHAKPNGQEPREQTVEELNAVLQWSRGAW